MQLDRVRFGTGMGEVRWDKVAEGLGCRGEFVESIADLASGLQRAAPRFGLGTCWAGLLQAAMPGSPPVREAVRLPERPMRRNRAENL